MLAEPQFLEFIGDAEEIYKYGKNGTDIYNALWQPLTKYIKEGEIVYFSPAGVLHQLSIEALPISATEILADKYDLRCVSSTREILQSIQQEVIKTAVLYGGILYDIDKESMEIESRTYTVDSTTPIRSIYDDGMDRGTASYLAGTLQEVENIAKTMKGKKVKYQLYSTDKANEESFLSLSGKRQDVLHIATHGFFWTDSVARSQKYFAQRQNDSRYTDPLTRCGLLFAGANIALRGNSNILSEGVQDGILTAKEISLLDLRNTKLVVLSACETARGEITGDGVFGLQRAFKQAGAQTIIMSLWKVDDEATQMLMTKFYEYWLAGDEKRIAFRKAQNYLRSLKDKYGDNPYANPEYWAAFIMLD